MELPGESSSVGSVGDKAWGGGEKREQTLLSDTLTWGGSPPPFEYEKLKTGSECRLRPAWEEGAQDKRGRGRERDRRADGYMGR